MNKRIFLLLGLAVAAGPRVSAEDLDLSPSGKPDMQTVSLSPYSLGMGGGAIAALNDELMDISEQFLKVSVIQSIVFQRHWSLGMDANWYLPGKNMGMNMNLDYLFGTGAFRPFIGAGGGIQYFDRATLGEGLGPSTGVHAGLLIDILDELQLRIRVPFQIVSNEDRDMTVGLDGGFLFSSHLRKKKVRKLNY
jgi:hypothetical protein